MWRSKLSGRKGALDWRPAEVGDARGHGSIEGSPSERGEMFILETRDALKKKIVFHTLAVTRTHQDGWPCASAACSCFCFTL